MSAELVCAENVRGAAFSPHTLSQELGALAVKKDKIGSSVDNCLLKTGIASDKSIGKITSVTSVSAASPVCSSVALCDLVDDIISLSALDDYYLHVVDDDDDHLHGDQPTVVTRSGVPELLTMLPRPVRHQVLRTH
jgi:hypothetical protein